MEKVNGNLLVLKLFLFWIYGALGSLWPFLTVHMRSIGLTMEETAIINLVLPFTSLMGPPMAGALADKIGRYRLVLVLCMLLAGVSYSSLLFVPPVIRHAPRQPVVSFSCGPAAGVIHMERCQQRCELPESKYQLELKHCRVQCPVEAPIIPASEVDFDEISSTNETQMVAADAFLKPILCFDAAPGECHVYNASGLDEPVVVYLNVLLPTHKTEETCQYQMLTFTRGGSDDVFQKMHCRVNARPECRVHCDVVEANTPKVLAAHRCVHMEGDAFFTFWVYFFLRGIAELFPPSCLALIDATILNMVRKHNGQYGKQILWGISAIAIFPPLVGYLNDHFGSGPGRADYTPAFIAFDSLLLLAAIMALFLDTERTEYVHSLCRNVGKLLRNKQVLVLFLVVFVLGTQFGFIETFFYWFLLEMGASQMLLGLTLTAGVLPSLPFLYFGERIVRKCGHANLLIVALFMYAIRFTGYAYIPGPWWSLPFEALEVFTLNLMWVTAATYCARLAPRMLLATTMGLTTVLHYNAGRGIGALAGGYVMDRFGARIAYQGCAVFSGFMGLIYFAVYHFYLKGRKEPVIVDPISNGHHVPSWDRHTANGEAQAYKPMLAAEAKA